MFRRQIYYESLIILEAFSECDQVYSIESSNVVAERLRRKAANPMFSRGGGSNPSIALISFFNSIFSRDVSSNPTIALDAFLIFLF